ncbi:MAG: RsmB/NOP family class I SAM-dependent RNA methyltransferase [Clostridia bacterium]|nr:RsmB/NOP family class I SAM-dependent RNA methyltransferase [Clostridia bacterium]
MYEKLKLQYDEEDLKKIIEGYTTKRKTTFRVNTLKSNIEEIEEVLKENNISYSKVKWYDDAFVINDVKENEIRNLKIYEEGKIYLQSLSSMMPVIFLNPNSGENILDMCAAPGGKTTQIATLSNNTSLITACEKNKIRAEKLKYNIEKQKAQKTTVLEQDAKNLSEFFSFDKILLDSPCSGSGTINIEDKKLEKYFTEDLVSHSIKAQQILLHKAISLLKPGHEMIYSTCSILKEENENNIEKVLKNNQVEIIPLNTEKLEDVPLLPSKIEGVITVCPTELYEGFFIAKLLKKK